MGEPLATHDGRSGRQTLFTAMGLLRGTRRRGICLWTLGIVMVQIPGATGVIAPPRICQKVRNIAHASPKKIAPPTSKKDLHPWA